MLVLAEFDYIVTFEGEERASTKEGKKLLKWMKEIYL